MPFTLPDLPYAFDALEPHIDARTMEIHHGKHHAGYVAKSNAALDGTKFADMAPADVLRSLGDVPDDKRTAVRNNLGGHYNHSLFWPCLAPAGKGGGGAPAGALAAAIDASFSSFDGFKSAFSDAAANRFGSGWAWLTVKDGVLRVCSTANQDNPIMGEIICAGGACSCQACGGTPILGLDVWEHAYYLHYQNRRPDYIAAFWNIVNWDQVAKNYASATG
ncbi:MAG: superoxide dismutase [Mn] [Planctomycetota bacterium]|nr:MAG: superoxide dismutase [Mn] [Planctomycetota bacterium]